MQHPRFGSVCTKPTPGSWIVMFSIALQTSAWILGGLTVAAAATAIKRSSSLLATARANLTARRSRWVSWQTTVDDMSTNKKSLRHKRSGGSAPGNPLYPDVGITHSMS